MRHARNMLKKRHAYPVNTYVSMVKPDIFMLALKEIELEANVRLDMLEAALKAMVAQARLEANLDCINQP